MTAYVVRLAYPLLLLTAVTVLALLLAADARRARRTEARSAEQLARPAGADPPTEISRTMPGHHATARRLINQEPE